MAVSDSVSISQEGTFEEQIQELVNYIVRNKSDEDRAAFIRPFQDALKTAEGEKPIEEDGGRKKKVISMVLENVQSLGEGSDREIEGFFNLLYAHIFSVYPADSQEARDIVSSLLKTISSSPVENSASRYRILSNLYNITPRSSSLRLIVYSALLDLSEANDEVELLQLNTSDVEAWLGEWDISAEDKSNFLKRLVDIYAKLGQPDVSYEYQLLLVRSWSSESPEGRAAALSAISSALRSSSIYNFDSLFKLDAVIAAKDEPLFGLLQIFLNDGLDEYQAWVKDGDHADVLAKHDLDSAQLTHKIRVLTLSSLAFKHIGQDVSYSQIASVLQIEPSEVEKWAIDVIRTGLVSGKLSQQTQSLRVIRAAARAFERSQWETLEKRLLEWKKGLEGVLEVVASTRKRAEGAGTSTAQSAQAETTAAEIAIAA